MIKISRQVRKNLNTSFFHVMIQGINKESIFKTENYIRRYLKILEKTQKERKVEIIAYCIMNNHAHLLIRTDNIEELSKFMQKTNGMYAQYYNFMQERIGYVFRDRYKTQPIMSQRQLIQCIKYIHQNPVKAGLVKDAGKYKFSSYKYLKSQENQTEGIFSKQELKFILESSIQYGNFIDIENNPNEIINNLIEEFLRKENVKVFEIFEKNDILKRLIKYLKEEHSIKYTDIMKKFDITKGVMERLK